MERLKVVPPDQHTFPESTVTSTEHTCNSCGAELDAGDWDYYTNRYSYECRSCRRESDKKAKEDATHKRMVDILGEYGVRHYTFDRFSVNAANKQAYDLAQAFDPEKDNLYIHGNCGSGKSHLAYAIVRKFIDREVCVLKSPDILRMMRLLKPEEEVELLDRLLAKYVLVIDDLGVGKSTEFANQTIYQIIDNRIMACKNGLVVTSNLSLSDFSKKAEDDRIPSRIAGLCKVVKITDKDNRVKR